jgi:molybdenum-dependent DNA-binding transcriptional regulator ModE
MLFVRYCGSSIHAFFDSKPTKRVGVVCVYWWYSVDMNWNNISFDWNQARSLLAVAEEGSLSAAANALGVTQPTMTRQIAALEDALGVTLFERTGRSVSLTQAGLDLLDHARKWPKVQSGFARCLWPITDNRRSDQGHRN